nr:hypothetical protein [Tanacetum cinerariifolium]
MYKEYLAEFWYSIKTLKNSKVFLSTPTGGIYEEVGVNTIRNTIAAYYLPHSSKYVAPPSINKVRPWFETIGYGEAVPAKRTLKKSLIPSRKPFTRSPNMYKEYLAEFWYPAKTLENSKVFFSTPTGGIYGEVGVNTFRIAICAHYLPHSSEYVAPSSIDIVRSWFETIRYGESVPIKETLKKSFLPPRQQKVGPLAFIDSKTDHSKKRKESSLAIDSNPSQPLVSTHVDTRTHKEDQQATSSPTSLGVTSEAKANPQLSSAASTVKANPGNYAPGDFVPQQQDQTKSVSEGLKTILTQPFTEKRASSVARQIKEETSNTIKLDDLAKMVSHVQPSFKDLDSPEDDPIIIVDDSDKDEDDEVHATQNSQKHKLKLEKNKAEAEVALLKAKTSFPNVEHLKELLVKSLKTKFSNILYAYDFSSSLPTELKDLPFKFDELTKEVKGLKKQVHELEIELPGYLKEIPSKLKKFTKTITIASVQAKLQTLDALPGPLLNVIKALNNFAQVLDCISSKSRDQSVYSAGQADTMPAEVENNTNQATTPSSFKDKLKRMLKRKT